jgi:hypothetical protein
MAPSRSSHHAAPLPWKGAKVSAYACILPGKKG